jgi:hypothetical protein
LNQSIIYALLFDQDTKIWDVYMKNDENLFHSLLLVYCSKVKQCVICEWVGDISAFPH